MKTRTAAALSLITLFVTASALAAGREAAAETSEFTGTSEVVLIEVPVQITTRDGQPIANLSSDSFRLFDNGREQRLANVEIVDLARIEATRQDLGRTAARLPGSARRHLLLLFDLSFSTPKTIQRAQQAARKLALEGLHATDLAAVAVFSIESGPRLLVTFTADRAQLARAIDTLGDPALLGRGAVVDPLRFVLENPSTDSGQEGLSASLGGDSPRQATSEYLNILALGADRAVRNYEGQRITAWSRAMADMARSLAGVSGRKQIVYFSEGFDGSLLLGKDSATDGESELERRYREQGAIWMIDNDKRFGSSKLRHDIDEMIEAFRRADCVIQAVDIGGLRADGLAAATAVGTQGQVGMSQEALFYIARETGGELFEDANNLDQQLVELLERTSVTYVLSYYPDRLVTDGSYHSLKVKVDLPRGARKSYRPGYYAPRPYQELHPLEKALLASEAITLSQPRREIEMRLLAAPFRAARGRSYVPVIIEILGASLLAGQNDDGAHIEIYAYVSDQRGEMQDFFTQQLTLALNESTQTGRQAFETSGLKYYGHLELSQGEYLLRVLVRNARTGRTGVETLELRVPPYDYLEPALLPPFFAEPADRWLLVRERTPERDRIVYPFTMHGQPYIPAALPQIDRDSEAEFYVVGYNLGKGQIELDGCIRDNDGQPIDAEVSLVERTETGIDGFDKILASLQPKDLDRGEYTLEVAVTNLSTGSQRSSSIPFVVN